MFAICILFVLFQTTIRAAVMPSASALHLYRLGISAVLFQTQYLRRDGFNPVSGARR